MASGSGTALLLELSKAFVQYKATNKVRFAWWGAEENGLLGSRYYCSNLETAEVDQVLAYLNFDMVSKGYIGVADTDGSTHGLAGPPGSDTIEHLFEDYYAARNIEITSVLITNGSDYASWWQILNKPFGYLHTGTGVAQDPCYHQACDTIENPDPETLTINAKVSLPTPPPPMNQARDDDETNVLFPAPGRRVRTGRARCQRHRADPQGTHQRIHVRKHPDPVRRRRFCRYCRARGPGGEAPRLWSRHLRAKIAGKEGKTQKAGVREPDKQDGGGRRSCRSRVDASRFRWKMNHHQSGRGRKYHPIPTS